MAKPGIVDRDMGMDAIVRVARHISEQKPHVVVGITGARGGVSHQGAEGLSVVEIGAVHEFGIPGKIPERSFLRATVDEHAKTYRAYITKGMQSALDEIVKTGTGDGAARTLKRTGLMVEGDIKKRIAAGIAPALSPVTIARKKSSKPLIDTGQLRASISSELRKGRSP